MCAVKLIYLISDC